MGQGMKREVLVVEDEAMIRLVAVEVFEDAGFVAHEAGSALEAIGILSRNPGIDVMFTDINLGGGPTGVDLAELVADRYPQMAVVVTSGRCQADNLSLPLGCKFLPKPHRLETMIEAVQALFEAKQSIPGRRTYR